MDNERDAIEREAFKPCDGDYICSALLFRIHGVTYEVTRGLASLYTINTNSGDIKFYGVVYKTNKRDKGLLINFCPFCGGKPGIFERS